MNDLSMFCLKRQRICKEQRGKTKLHEALTFLPFWVNFAGTSNECFCDGVDIPVKAKHSGIDSRCGTLFACDRNHGWAHRSLAHTHFILNSWECLRCERVAGFPPFLSHRVTRALSVFELHQTQTAFVSVPSPSTLWGLLLWGRRQTGRAWPRVMLTKPGSSSQRNQQDFTSYHFYPGDKGLGTQTRVKRYDIFDFFNNGSHKVVPSWKSWCFWSLHFGLVK